MSVLWNKAWRDLRVRPARSLLTLVGIVIGVAGVVAVVMAGRTLAWAQRQAYQHHSQADIAVWVWNADESVVRALEALPGVAAAERRAVAYTRWRAGKRWLDIQLEGIERFEDVRVNQMALLEGRNRPGRFGPGSGAPSPGPADRGARAGRRSAPVDHQRLYPHPLLPRRQHPPPDRGLCARLHRAPLPGHPGG
jgi:hypothetical protein